MTGLSGGACSRWLKKALTCIEVWHICAKEHRSKMTSPRWSIGSRWDNQGSCFLQTFCRSINNNHVSTTRELQLQTGYWPSPEDFEVTMQRESSWGCGILSELHKFGSKNLHRCLLQLFHLILNSMTTPEDFTTSIIVPLLKTGKPRDMCSSFQPVSFLCTAREVMTSALLSTCRPELTHQWRSFGGDGIWRDCIWLYVWFL